MGARPADGWTDGRTLARRRRHHRRRANDNQEARQSIPDMTRPPATDGTTLRFLDTQACRVDEGIPGERKVGPGSTKAQARPMGGTEVPRSGAEDTLPSEAYL